MVVLKSTQRRGLEGREEAPGDVVTSLTSLTRKPTNQHVPHSCQNRAPLHRCASVIYHAQNSRLLRVVGAV